jgi:hypothetical protein
MAVEIMFTFCGSYADLYTLAQNTRTLNIHNILPNALPINEKLIKS